MFVRRDLTDTVPTPSGNMHFVKKGSGYPVILLHPAGTSVWAWESVLETLSQSFACYAFDMMGHGDSDKPSRHFGIPDYAQALDQACQILNIHRAHVVGNSVGAVLAIETAASFPERVDKLVLVGCPVWDVYTAKERFRKGAQIDEQGMPTHQTLKTLIDASTFADPRQEWLDASNQLRTKAGLWYGKLWESLAHYNIMARLPRIQASSTMVLYGDSARAGTHTSSRRPRGFFGITATFSHDVIFEQCDYGVRGMKLPVVLAVLTGTLVLACSTTVPAPVEHTPNIGATSSRGYVN